MPILNLSKEQYNTFLNSNSLDDFINLRNSIEVNDKLVSIPKDYIAIRILSDEEYNKFIKNSTLDGSITNYDINTWHYQNQYKKYVFCISYYAQANYVNRFLSSEYRYDKNWFPGADISPEVVVLNDINDTVNRIDKIANVTLNCNSEHFNNNTNNKNSFSDIYVGGHVHRQDNGENWGHFSFTFSTANLETKITDIASPVYTCTARYIPQWNACVGKVTVNILMSFRPVFNFVNNNKSTNIHY